MDSSKEEEEEKQVGNVEEEKNGLVVLLHPPLPPLRYLLVVAGRCIVVTLIFHDDPVSGKRTVVGMIALPMVLVLCIFGFRKEGDAARSFFDDGRVWTTMPVVHYENSDSGGSPK
jgi:hypothetical protein